MHNLRELSESIEPVSSFLRYKERMVGGKKEEETTYNEER